MPKIVKEIVCNLDQFTSKEGVTFNRLVFTLEGEVISTQFIDNNGALKLLLKGMGYELYEKPKDNQ